MEAIEWADVYKLFSSFSAVNRGHVTVFYRVLLLSVFMLSLDQTDFTDTAIDGELTATEVCDLSSILIWCDD